MVGSATGYALRSADHQQTSTRNPEEDDSTELFGLDSHADTSKATISSLIHDDDLTQR